MEENALFALQSDLNSNTSIVRLYSVVTSQLKPGTEARIYDITVC